MSTAVTSPSSSHRSRRCPAVGSNQGRARRARSGGRDGGTLRCNTSWCRARTTPPGNAWRSYGRRSRNEPSAPRTTRHRSHATPASGISLVANLVAIELVRNLGRDKPLPDVLRHELPRSLVRITQAAAAGRLELDAVAFGHDDAREFGVVE